MVRWMSFLAASTALAGMHGAAAARSRGAGRSGRGRPAPAPAPKPTYGTFGFDTAGMDTTRPAGR